MTLQEIEEEFDGEWVLVGEPQTNEHLEVLSGKVLHHSKDRTERIVTVARAIATTSAARGIPGEFCIGGGPASFHSLNTRLAAGWIGLARRSGELLNCDRAVHPQLVVTRLRAEELVGAGLVVCDRRGTRLSALLEYAGRCSQTLLGGEVV